MTAGRSAIAILALGAGLLPLNLAGLYAQSRDDIDGLIAILLLESALYLAAVHMIGKVGESRRLLGLILVVAALLRLGPLMLPPFLSSDIYRYVWDGRVQGAGINPYRYLPSDEVLANLRDQAVYPNINRVGYAHTIYPPVAEMIFFAVTRISDGVAAMKLAMIGFEAGTIVLLLLLLRRGGAPPSRILIYAWHPLAVWEIAGSGHVDAAVCFFIAAALLARQRNAPASTGLALAGGAMIKFFPGALVPAFWHPWDWRMPLALAAGAALAYLPYISAGWQVLGFLPGYAAEERFSTGSGFYVLNLADYAFGFAEPLVVLYVGLAAVALIALASLVLLKPRPGAFGFAEGALLLGTALFLAVTPHHAWYFLWLLPILCAAPYWPVLLLTASSFLLYATLGLQPPARDLVVNSLLYGPFLLAAVIQLCVHRRAVSQAAPNKQRIA